MTLRDFPATDRLPEMKRCSELTAHLIARLNTGVMPSAETSPRLVETSERPAEEPSLLAETPDDGVDSLTGVFSKLGILPSSRGEQGGTE